MFTYRLFNESLDTETKLLRKLIISWNFHSGHCIVMTYWYTMTVILLWYVHQRDRTMYSQYRSLMVEIVWSLSYYRIATTLRNTEFKETALKQVNNYQTSYGVWRFELCRRKICRVYCGGQYGQVTNRPFALRGHVTSSLWKWKLYDFFFKKRLVGHIFNKIIVIWFCKPEPFS